MLPSARPMRRRVSAILRKPPSDNTTSTPIPPKMSSLTSFIARLYYLVEFVIAKETRGFAGPSLAVSEEPSHRVLGFRHLWSVPGRPTPARADRAHVVVVLEKSG